MDFSKIKLIIWDLDETFWSGILSEGSQSIITENIQLIKDLIDAGVMCSICSKNNHSDVQNYMEKLDIWQYFVFPSINWTSKGLRVKQIIQEMQLREQNVLFIDDNNTNLAEVLSTCKEISVSNECIIKDLIVYYRNIKKKDLEHSRLKQYKILEKKKKFQATASSNEDFLRKCGIIVTINNDCMNHIDRIEDLLLRSNQLNFTKLRSTKDDLKNILENKEYISGYIQVKDNFGDYGIVGFYTILDNTCIHFTFSCRTLNMGVEQYVYHKIGKPKLKIVGEVSSSLDGECPDWINLQSIESEKHEKNRVTGRLVVKGPCDMSQMFSYIKESNNIVTEFTYVGRNGVSIEGANHTVHMLQALTLSEDTKKKLLNELPFADSNMYTTAIYDSDVSYVVYSLFTDPNLGLYQERETGAIVAFGEYTNDLTDESKWDKYISQEVFVAGCQFTKVQLEFIKRNYKFLGRLSPEEVLSNLKKIFENLSMDTILILNLGSEIPFLNNTQEAYKGREVYNKELNMLVRRWAEDNTRVRIIDTNDYLHNQKSFTNNINHFSKEVYYKISSKLIEIINEYDNDNKYRQFSMIELRLQAVFDTCIRVLKKIKWDIINKLK